MGSGRTTKPFCYPLWTTAGAAARLCRRRWSRAGRPATVHSRLPQSSDVYCSRVRSSIGSKPTATRRASWSCRCLTVPSGRGVQGGAVSGVRRL